jgi:hypothetical protein
MKLLLLEVRRVRNALSCPYSRLQPELSNCSYCPPNTSGIPDLITVKT